VAGILRWGRCREKVVKDYGGRLLPYRPIIAAMILAGQSSSQIGRLLCALGARSNWDHRGVDNLSSTTGLVHALKKKWERKGSLPAGRRAQRFKIGDFRATVVGSWTPEDVWRETEGLQKGKNKTSNT
jgi:hypothetical protein